MPGIRYEPPVVPPNSEVEVIVDGVKKGKMNLDKKPQPVEEEIVEDNNSSPPPSPSSEQKPRRGRRRKSTQNEEVSALLAKIAELEAKLAAKEQGPIPATTDQLGLDYLTNPPSKPSYEVIFDLGRGGKHLKRFHDVIVSDVTIGFVYDTRYEGDQFIPPTTGEEDEPFSVTLVKENQTFRVLNPIPLGYRLGCLDVVVLLRSNSDEQPHEVATEINPKYSF